MNYSSQIVKNNKWRVYWALMVGSLISQVILIVGIIAFVIGIIPAFGIAIFFNNILAVAIYRNLEKNYEENNKLEETK